MGTLRPEDLPGMPLDQALVLLRQMGIEPTVEITSDPRHHREDGELRVLRVRGATVTAARFLTGAPREEQP